MIGKTVSHYKISEKLGEGGMGVVYKAHDTKLDRIVALKFLSPQALRSEEEHTRFIHEARAAAALNHPNICTIHEIDEDDEHRFIAMEFIEGESLRDRIERGPLKLDEAADIALQIANGLSDAHKKGIVHRDIKSANIMFNERGDVKIMDFGLAWSPGRAQLTREGTTLGTVSYMSPEQARAGETDHRTDLWSLGVVLYEMTAGHPPFMGDYEQAIIYSILNDEPEPLTAVRTGVPPELEQIVSKCLLRDPAERYQTAADLAADLRRVQRLGSTQKWQERVEEAKTRSRGRSIFQRPMSRGLWLYLLCVPIIAVLIITVIVPRYFSSDVVPPGPERKMLAVLPFENLGPPEEEYFADGITEELTARLARIEGLGVIARTSVIRYKKTEETIAEIGKELGVDFILEGTIRWQHISDSQSQVRITPQLIKVSDETHLWAEVYQRDMTDIFRVQSEIADEVAGALDITLLAPESKKRAASPTDDPDAYRAYLEGRFWWNKRSAEGFDRAIGFFDEAIRIDPDYALAYSGKAECYCMLAMHSPRPGGLILKARQAAEKALSLDETLPEAYTSLAWIEFYYEWDWRAAEEYFKQALSLDPGYATAHNWYAASLAIIGRFEEAIEHMEHAHRLDPGNLIINRDLGVIYSWAGMLDESAAQLRKTIEMDPSFVPAYMILGRVYLEKGMYDEAIAESKKGISMSGEDSYLIGQLGFIYAKAGRRDEAKRELDKLMELSRSEVVPAFVFAMIHAGLGNDEEALDWLEKSCDDHEFAMVLLHVEHWMDDLQSNPRYKSILKKVGLKQ